MTDSNAVKAAPRPGQFKNGDDSRRNTHGQIGKSVLKFNKCLRDLIITEGERKHTDAEGKVTLKKVEWLTRVVWNKALQGEPWAVTFIAERTEGKVTQPIAAEQNIVYRVIYEKPKDKDKVDANG